MKNKTEFSFEIQQEANKGNKKVGMFALIFGIVILALYMLNELLVAFAEAEETDGSEILLFVGVLEIILGALILINVKKTNKAYDGDGRINEYEFTKEYMTLHSTRYGETTADIKHTYDEIVKLKETEKYLFLFINAITLYPVEKTQMTLEELEILRGYIKEGLKSRKAKFKNK